MPEFALTQEDKREYLLVVSEIHVDEGPDRVSFWLTDAEAVLLYEAVEAGIGGYVREMRAAKREFEEARAAMLDELFDPESGYTLGDPKHPTYHERMAEAWDNREKT
jgi:hypothetical protein